MMIALSIYGLLLIFVSSDNMNPKFIITNFKNRYLAVFDPNRANGTNIGSKNVNGTTKEPIVLLDKGLLPLVNNASPTKTSMISANMTSNSTTLSGSVINDIFGDINDIGQTNQTLVFNTTSTSAERVSLEPRLTPNMSHIGNITSTKNITSTRMLVTNGTRLWTVPTKPVSQNNASVVDVNVTKSVLNTTALPPPSKLSTTTRSAISTQLPANLTQSTPLPATSLPKILPGLPLLRPDNTSYASTPLITLFTTFKNSPDKTHVYKNTIRNWHLLSPWVKPILYTINGELDMTRFAKNHGWEVLPVPATSRAGVPILRHMFLDAQKRCNSTFYGYANGDILFTDGLVDTLQTILSSLDRMKQVLIVGRRTNFKLTPHQEITTLEEVAKFGKKGELFSTNAQDYFISTRDGYPWATIPDFVVGRVGYDNWLVVTALVRRMYTIDTTKTLLAFHQTGTDGNYAGHRKKPKGDTYINYGLAGKKFDYSLGHVSCGQFYTEGTKGNIKILQRNKNGCERTFKRFHVSPYLSLKPAPRRLLL